MSSASPTVFISYSHDSDEHRGRVLGLSEQVEVFDEAWEISERGPMRLHLTNIHLHRARLFHDKEELQKARALIEHCGFWRRRDELEDAEVAAQVW